MLRVDRYIQTIVAYLFRLDENLQSSLAQLKYTNE